MISRRARLRSVYVERGGQEPPVVWLSGPPASVTDRAEASVHRTFDRIVDRARYDRTSGYGRIVRAGRVLLAEAEVGRVHDRLLRATLVVSAAGGWPGWAAPCAVQAASVLHSHGLPGSADGLQRVLECGWRDSARWRRLLRSFRRPVRRAVTRLDPS